MAEGARNARRTKTAERILDAARAEFAADGFEKATIRSIADRAGVHASLVMQHYKSKAALFTAATRLIVDDDVESAEHVSRVLDARMHDLPPETRALLRSMLTSREAEAAMRGYLDERVAGLAATLDGDDVTARALVTVTGILGLTIARHFLALEAFDAVPHEQLVTVASALLSPAPGSQRRTTNAGQSGSGTTSAPS